MAEPQPTAKGLGSLNDLRALVAVAESGSFSLAAQQLGLSQPAISQRVRNLESAWGMRLIDRRANATLTKVGKEVFVRARQILLRVDELDAAAADLRGLEAGQLSLGYATPAFAIPLIAAFTASHPGVHVTCDYGNTEALFRGLHECRLDAAVTSLISVPEELASQRIATQRLMLCVPRGHPLIDAEPPTLAELAGLPLLMREHGSMTRQLVEHACQAKAVVLTRTSMFPTRESIKEAVAAGLGLGFVLSGEIGADARLCGLPVADVDEPVGVHVVCLRETLDLPTVSKLFELGAVHNALTTRSCI